jgi:hypothetical protein
MMHDYEVPLWSQCARASTLPDQPLWTTVLLDSASSHLGRFRGQPAAAAELELGLPTEWEAKDSQQWTLWWWT